MSTFGERVRAARKKAGLTQRNLAERLQMRSPNTISNWEMGTNRPDIDQLVKLSRALGAGPEYLLGCYSDSTAPQLTDAEKTLVERYRSTDAYGRKAIETIAELESLRCAKPMQTRTHTEYDRYRFLNVYGQAAAGPGTWLSDEAPVPAKVLLDARSSRADYAVEVSGDSMEPDYVNGDLLLVQQTSVIDEGELGIFAYDGLGYFKKLGHGELLSLNPAYAPIVPDGPVAIQGRVIGKAERSD